MTLALAELLSGIFVAVAAGGWAVWIWRTQREKDRDQEKKRLAALYVGPFLRACHDLQSRLWNLLENNGLDPLRTRYPGGEYAEETLYLLAQYLAWERCLLRYTEYPGHPDVIALIESIRKALATDSKPKGLPDDSLFRLQQQSLGRLLLEQRGGEFGTEFDTIPFEEFQKEFAGHELSKDTGIQNILAALRSGDLKNIRRRFAPVQQHLVKLLEYMEGDQDIRFWPKGTERKKARSPED